MITQIEEIKKRLDRSGDVSAAISALSALLETTSDPSSREQIYMERGLLHWRMEHRADAINDYNAALRINPRSKAQTLRDQAYQVLDFYNKDLFNP